VTLPLVLLAIPSVSSASSTIGPMLFGDYFKGVIHVGDRTPIRPWPILRQHFHGAVAMAIHGLPDGAVLARARRCRACRGSST
jgi:NADH-quinone oxidoreductase subunit L